MNRLKKQGFQLTELMVTIAVIGCLLVLGFTTFNKVGLDNNLLSAKQARLESALLSAVKSIVGQENGLPASQACDVSTMKSLLMDKMANAEDAGKITVDDEELEAIKVANAGLVCIQVGANCQTTFGAYNPQDSDTNSPVVLLAIPNENADNVTGVPVKAGGAIYNQSHTEATSSLPSEAIISFNVAQNDVKEGYSYTPSKATTLASSSSSKLGTYVPKPNTVENACFSPTFKYENPCSPGTELAIYYNVIQNDDGSCELTFCPGNGIGTDGSLVTSGKVANACVTEGGNASQCACPNNRQYYVQRYSQNGINGLCVEDCSVVGAVASGRSCVCPEGTTWNSSANMCITPGSCPEEYLTWNGSECICDSAKVTLASDEIFSTNVANACKEKCDTANYYFPNATKTACIQQLPTCNECLKELNMTNYTCECKDVASLTNTDMIICNVPDNQYYTGVGACVATCDYDYKVRNTNDITSCVCPTRKPASLTLGAFEKYDTTSVTCKSCGDVNVTNRVYDKTKTSCECLASTAITFASNEVYDISQPNCKNTCPAGQVPNENHTECYTPVCADTIPANFVVPQGKFYNPTAGLAAGCISDCPKGAYCPGTSGSPDLTIDPNPTPANSSNNPDIPAGIVVTGVYLCPCGYYGATTGLSISSCSGVCPAGYKCSAGSVNPYADKCNSTTKICTVGSCSEQDCASPLVANTNHDSCICPASSDVTLIQGYYYDATALTGNNLCQTKCPTTAAAIQTWVAQNQAKFAGNPKAVYDSTVAGCISECDKPNFVASYDKLQCVCGLSPNAVPAGKYLVSTATECEYVTCPSGHYCPGSNNDPNPNPIPDVNYPNNGVIFCPCGTYGAATGLQTYACSGKCSAGYNCPVGSTTSTQVQCTGNQLCKAGVCEIETCSQYTKPNTNHTACVCKPANEIAYKGANWVYDAAQPECQYQCEGVKVRNNNNPSQCICPSSKPVGYSIPEGYQYDPTADFCISNCPVGHYCPGTTGDVVNDDVDDTVKIPMDENHPEVLKCLCGHFGATMGNKKAKCDGPCHSGYNCPAGSTSPTQNACTGNQLCKAGVCAIEECSQYRQPNDYHTECECKSINELNYKGDNWYYDITQEDCQAQCSGVLVRSQDKRSCVCPATKPATMVIPAGKHYDASAVSTGCLTDCPAGSYCPGTQPSNPDVLVVDPDDTNPIVNPSYPEGDVLKCLCGYYGNIAGNTNAKCNGACSAGYNCPAGSTTPTANACASGKICQPGVCEPQACPNPLVANASQTQCICPASSEITLAAGYYYDSTVLAGNNLCQAKCPTDPAGINAWVAQNKSKFAGKEKAVYDSSAVGCIATCEKANFIASVDRLSCICGLSPNNVPAGKYLISTPTECRYVECPVGHYCPGSNPDENPDPQPDPNYPSGVMICPCGNYGSTTGLATYNCSGKCKEGYYCPQGSITDTGKTSEQGQEHACTAGQLCQQGTCNPGTCSTAFPLTSAAPYTSCSVCMSEAAIKAQNPNYFGQYEVYAPEVTTGSRLCKTCSGSRIYDNTGACVCPADKPYEYNGTCNKCQNWGTLFFARNLSSSEPNCTLYKFMKGDKVCFAGGKARQVDENMSKAADKLSSADKNRNFKGVFAYMVSLSPDGKTASVVGTFTIDSWYAIFPNDIEAYNARTYDQNLVKGTCAKMCNNNAECMNTCNYFNGKITSNSMTNNCKYVNTEYTQHIGKSYGNAYDEFCSGGNITMQNGCVYNVGAFLRRYASPLVLDLNGDGFNFTTVPEGVVFDLDNDGYAERVSWTAEQTTFDNAFLVLDKNGNGQVDNGGELFGDQNGSKNGFEELAKYDDNKDNVINKDDKIYADLKLWVDFNKNAKVDANVNGQKELKSLEEANVTEISLVYEEKKNSAGKILKDIWGNITGIAGSFKMMITDAAGKLVEAVRSIIDVFFMTE